MADPVTNRQPRHILVGAVAKPVGPLGNDVHLGDTGIEQLIFGALPLHPLHETVAAAPAALGVLGEQVPHRLVIAAGVEAREAELEVPRRQRGWFRGPQGFGRGRQGGQLLGRAGWRQGWSE